MIWNRIRLTNNILLSIILIVKLAVVVKSIESRQFMSEISKEEAEEVSSYVENGGVGNVLSYMKEKLSSWQNIPLNIAVIGSAGVGKSSFINAIRGLNADDYGAAKVGVTETTSVPESFEHPKNENLKFWDLPGIGSPNFPKDQYLKKIKFDRYDCFIIITHNRFTENDGWLAQKIKHADKQFHFVRTKMAADIENDKKAHPKTHDNFEVLKRVRKDIDQNLKALDVLARAFLIDSYERGNFDFSLLDDSIIEAFPEQKRKALIMSMQAFSAAVVHKKVKLLAGRIWYASSASVLGAILPLPGMSFAVDVGLIAHEVWFYYTQLGLDEDSLEKSAALHSVNVGNLKNIIRDALPYTTGLLTIDAAKAVVLTMLKQPTVVAAMVTEEFTRYIPIVGPLISSPISFLTTKSILNRFLDDFENVALKIVDEFIKTR